MKDWQITTAKENVDSCIHARQRCNVNPKPEVI
jgi:hypothetical protein